jgi:ATP/maltotriose-dependent transcriptional regulator MalT
MRAVSVGRPGQILLLCAPPGFEKTIALAEWYSAMKAADMQCAWMTIDSTDDSRTALQYLAFACYLNGLNVAPLVSIHTIYAV